MIGQCYDIYSYNNKSINELFIQILVILRNFNSFP